MSGPGNGETDLRLDDDCVRWARQVLQAPDDEGDRLRGFLMRSLADEEFVLSDRVRSAILALSSDEPSSGIVVVPDEFCADREQNLTDEIDEFAAAFFSLSREERSARWRALRERKEVSPSQRVRLGALQAGLDVESEDRSVFPDRVAELAQLVRELFVLTPPRRAERWRRERIRMEPDIAEWSLAAGALKKQQRQTASMLPDITEELVLLHPTRRLQAQNQERRLRTKREGQALRESAYVTEDEFEKKTSGASSGWTIAVIAAIVIGIRAFVSSDNSSSDPALSFPETPSFDSLMDRYPDGEFDLKTPLRPGETEEDRPRMGEAMRRLLGKPPRRGTVTDVTEKAPGKSSPGDDSKTTPKAGSIKERPSDDAGVSPKPSESTRQLIQRLLMQRRREREAKKNGRNGPPDSKQKKTTSPQPNNRTSPP